MTPKESIRNLVERMPDNIILDEVFYRLELFISVYTGMRQIERGDCVDHDELFDELLKEDEEEKNNMVQKSQKRPFGNKRIHRARLAKNAQNFIR